MNNLDKELRSDIRVVAKQIKKYNSHFDLDKFFRAFEYSYKAHEGQKRRSGEDYIWHPVSVAKILAEYEADETTIVASLLHDIVEDTDIKITDIEDQFGFDIAGIVDGVTKLGRIDFISDEDEKVENFRKMFLAMAKDIRVIIIKLADRLHNMRTLKYLSEEKQKRIAKETQDVYAALAHRLGMSNMKWELEDLCFRFLHELDYQKLKKEISEKREERENYIHEFVAEVERLLRHEKINPFVTGRPKHFWSIYNKMLKQRTSIKNLYDLYAIRIVVKDVKECYGALGIIHSNFKPIPGRFKDYIAMPKQNMYQSIHTVVIGERGKPVEVQIRTEDMHRVSEFGIAAHWRYKEGKKKDDLFEKKLAWLRELIDWQKDVDNKDFYENLKVDLFTDEIFVFTPKGDVFELHAAATVLDFAYRVHTEIGHRFIGAKVNNRIANITTTLTNGDIVEIITSKNSSPKFDWLKVVKTSSARNKIRQWLKKNTEIFDEIKPIDKEIAKKTVKKEETSSFEETEQVFESKKKPEGKRTGIIVQDTEDIYSYLSRCCNPVPGDSVVGYITKNRGIAVHQKQCKNVRCVERERLVKVQWDDNFKGSYEVALEIEAYDRLGLMNDVFAKIAEEQISIVNGQLKTTSKGKAFIDLILSLTKIEMLDSIMGKIKQIKEVYEVRRKGI